MSILINDQLLAAELLAQRRANGADIYDEVWDGVYVMAPMANNQHQSLATELAAVLMMQIDWCGLGKTLAGANVSDRRENWTQNYRIPDVLVFLQQTSAEDCGTHWFGGPDFAIEIVSPDDKTFEKLDFYAEVGTKELLVVERNPWKLTLYRLKTPDIANVTAAVIGSEKQKLVPVAVSSFSQPTNVASEVLPLQISLQPTPPAIRLSTPNAALIRDIPI